ncbi:unnamed protein product [Brassica oleracea]
MYVVWCGGFSWIPVVLRRILLVGLRLSCSWCVVTLEACGRPIDICGLVTGEVVYLLALSRCGVASEAREEPIHSRIAYLLWIWRGSTSTVIYCNHAGLVSSLSGFAFSL